jgi:hypothetical protein
LMKPRTWRRSSIRPTRNMKAAPASSAMNCVRDSRKESPMVLFGKTPVTPEQASLQRRQLHRYGAEGIGAPYADQEHRPNDTSWPIAKQSARATSLREPPQSRLSNRFSLADQSLINQFPFLRGFEPLATSQANCLLHCANLCHAKPPVAIVALDEDLRSSKVALLAGQLYGLLCIL